MEEFKKHLAEKIREARNSAKLTQAELAKSVADSGVPCTQSQIAGYENPDSKSMPDAEKLAAIGNALGKSLDWLCENGRKIDNVQNRATSEQWLSRTLDMIEYSESHKSYIVGAGPSAPRRELEPRIALDIVNQWPNGRHLAFSIDFHGENMYKFIKAVQSVKELKSTLDPETYINIRNAVIKQYADIFDPDYPKSKLNQ